MNTLTAYEKLAVGLAITQKLNSIKFSYDRLKHCTPEDIEDRMKKDYDTLLSAAYKLQLNIDKDVEGLD